MLFFRCKAFYEQIVCIFLKQPHLICYQIFVFFSYWKNNISVLNMLRIKKRNCTILCRVTQSFFITKIYDVAPERYFNPGLCDGAFLTTEYTYDAQILKRWFVEQLAALPNVAVLYSHKPTAIEKVGSAWRVQAGGITAEAPYLLNATYAGVNDVHAMLGLPPFGIKYEKCEIILCTVDKSLKNTGITVMDGPFFSLMPFGRTGLHSLTSVTFTPHETSYDSVATFPCQQECGGVCKPGSLYNCNECPAKPQSAWPYMSQLARKYLKEEYGFAYHSSLFSMKPILKASEIDDSRPTVVRVMNDEPKLVSVLSGKINTVYDLDEVLDL